MNSSKDQGRGRALRIEVEMLNEDGEAFAHRYAPGELALNDETARLISETYVSGFAQRKERQVLLRGQVRAQVEASCDRCLRPVEIPVASEFDARFVPATALHESADESELQSDELGVIPYEGESIDVDSLVHEEILLARPMRLLCREDCQGLCPSCGTDLNQASCACEKKELDQRWSALSELKNRS